jgi:hypothetical protein
VDLFEVAMANAVAPAEVEVEPVVEPKAEEPEAKQIGLEGV